MPTPTIRWNVDANGNWATTADWNLHRLPNSTDDVAINTADPHTITHSTGTDTVHTLTVGNDNFVVSGGSLTINSTSTFANGLVVSGGKLKFVGAATARFLSQSNSTVSGGGTLTVTGPALFSANLLQTGSGRTVLQGPSTFTGASFGLDGGRVLDNQGTLTMGGTARILLGYNPFVSSIGGGTLKNDAGGTIDIQGANEILPYSGATSFTNAGTLEKTGATGGADIFVNFTDTGVIRIASGPLFFEGATDSFAGPVSGAGSFAFSGGTQALNSGAILTVANWSIAGSAATSVNENLTYAGTFTQDATSTLTVATGDNLSLTGGADVNGTLNGAGRINLSTATLAGLTLGGTATLIDVGTVDQVGIVTIGDASSNAATLSIAVGATYRIDNNSDIFRGNSAASIIQNSGLIIKPGGTGTSVIGVGITGPGAIEVTGGTLDLTQAITGVGTMAVDIGATLEADGSVAAGLGMTFKGGNATLALGSPATFAATIHGFAPTDTIDLLKTLATAATLGPGDTLAIKNGATTIATLQLAGTFRGDTFHVASDGNGGTNITVTTPFAAHVALGGGTLPHDQMAGSVAGHRFIAAMAGFGADIGGLAHVVSDARFVHPSMLAAPRMAMA